VEFYLVGCKKNCVNNTWSTDMLKKSFIIASVLAVSSASYFLKDCVADHHEKGKTESSHEANANKDSHNAYGGLTEEEFKRLHPSMPLVAETTSVPMKHPSAPVGSENQEEGSNTECSKTNSCGNN
jgi:hypothetical protein